MRVIALEEHFGLPVLQKRLDPEKVRARGYPPPDAPWGWARIAEKMNDLGGIRLTDMDEGGVTQQVLSLGLPGSDLLGASESPAWAREANDMLADAARSQPQRFAGFAHLPLTNPAKSAKELQRCVSELGFRGALVNGTVDGLFLDDPRFDDVLSVAESLDVPIYVHPNVPPPSVTQAYYSNLPDQVAFTLSMAGWGWHSETAIHILRLVLSGTLDKHPKLKLIVGHMGEGLQVMLARCDGVFGPATAKLLKRSVSETLLDQLWVTTSGFFWSPPFVSLLHSFGADRILFSVDYPFSANDRGTAFLKALPISPEDKEKIAYKNAAKLLKM